MTHWSRFTSSPSPRVFKTLRLSSCNYFRNLFNRLNFYLAVVLSSLAVAISTQSAVAADGTNCTANECNYSVPLDKPGFYTVAVTLPAGQKEGLYNLLIDPSVPYAQAPFVTHANGFLGGGLLRENGQTPSWLGFSLAQFEPVNLTVYNHSNASPLDLILTNNSHPEQMLLKFGPILAAHAQTYTIPVLEPGFYVASVRSYPGLPKTAYSVSIGANSLFGGVSGGWLDANNVGWGGFYATQPRTVNFKIQFANSFGEMGAGSPNARIYYRKEDGTQELKWSTIEQNTEWNLVEPTIPLVLPEPTVLPPDPGESGKISLEGIDSDKDGVRDDIQRYIALTYPNPEDKPFRSALREYSASQQIFLLEAGDKWKTVANAENRAKQIDCILYTRPTDGQASLVNLRAEYLNTESRTRSYLNADDQLGGQSISLMPYEELPQLCQRFVTNESALSNRSSVRSDSCKKDTPVVISLSNGGMTDAESAQRELTTLRTQVENAKKTSAFSGEKMSFVVSYTRGWVSPFLNLAKSKLAEESPNNTSMFWHWLGNTKPLPYELMNIAQNLANNPSVVAEKDLESQVSTYRTFIDEGRKVVAIGHSEGNFYANQAYINIDEATTLRARKDSFGVVSIAPPVMMGNCARVEVGSVVAVAGEGCTTLATDTVSSAGASVDILNNVTRPLPSFIVDPLGHSLDSYLNGDVSGPKIVNDVFSTISKLTPAPIVSQGAITVRLEWGQQLDVDLHVYEPNGSHVYFANKQGTSGYLDRDDLDKEGPEHYYSKCDTLQTGLYKVAVNYYSGTGAETARINISAGETTRSYTVPLAAAVGQNGNDNPVPVVVVKVSRDEQSGEFKFDILSQQVAEKKEDSTLGICAGGDFHDESSGSSCIDGNCSFTGVKIVCTSDSCQWCDIHNTCGNIKYNDTTQITGGSISCRNGNCNYSLRSGGSSSSGNFYCKGTSSTPSSVTTPSAVPLIITQITDPAVSLGMLFTDDQQKETLAVFGKKDSSGQLISVEKVTLMSNEDNSKWVTTFFGADHLPTLEFPDGSQARFSNATQTTVDITLFNSSGKLIAGPVTQAADVAKLLQLKDTLEKDGVQSGLRTICIPKWFDNIIWLIFQGISAESCATSTAVALAVPETVVPIAMALWACGSLVLGSVEKMSETSGGKTLLSPVNRYNKIAKAGFSCLSKDLKGCFLGLNKVAYSEAKNSDEATVQRDCNSADTPTKPQSNVIGENLNFGGAGCALTLNRVSVEKGQTTIKFAIDYSISSLGPDIDNPDDKWFSQVELWPNSSNCTGEHASFDHDIKDVLWNAKPNTATEQIVEISPSRTPHSVSITIPDDGSGNCSQYRWCKSLSE